MTKVELASRVEALALSVVMVDPHDLQAASQLIKQFENIAADGSDVDLSAALKPLSKAAVNLIEDMIVQEGEQAETTLNTLRQIVSAIQAALLDGPQAALKLLPPELNPNAAVCTTLPANVDEKILTEFLAQQVSVLEEMEGCILAIEKKGPTGKSVGAMKRILHTLKGESGMLGLADVGRLCHETESCLEQPGQANLADGLLKVKDWLGQKFDFVAGKGQPPEEVKDAMDFFRVQAVKPVEESEDKEKDENDGEGIISLDGFDVGLVQGFISEAREHLDNADTQLLAIESDSENKEVLDAVFRSFHTIKGGAGFMELTDISKLAHIAEDILDKARKGTLALCGTAIDLVFETVDTMRRLVTRVEQALTNSEPVAVESSLSGLIARLKEVADGKTVDLPGLMVDPAKKLGEILLENGRIKVEDLAEALKDDGSGQKLGEKLVKMGSVPAREMGEVLRAQQVSRNNAQPVEAREMIKIDTERLDKLLDAIGELVIADSMVSADQETLANASPHFRRNLSRMSSIIRNVQEMGMSMRMVPIKPVFQKMARLVRDLSKKSGKNVEFITLGEETELDRSVVEQIGDPLIHLIRNSIDHGIEDDPAVRINAGKTALARVELKAFYRGGSICIELSDDGRGLDRDAILAKAKEKGVIQEGRELSEQEVFQLIFAPGFSTAKKVTDVSGRGVGMDVVKRNIQSLRGNVELFSKRGKGTTVSMRLPLTLAIIDGLIIQVGSHSYIIPILSVVESLRPRDNDLFTVCGSGEMLSVRGALIPLFRLANVFKVPGAIEEPSKAIAIIVEAQGCHIALLVDALVGSQQVVIKNMGEGLGKIEGISGGAIMADGKVGLILDIFELIKLSTASGNGKKPVSSSKEVLMEENGKPSGNSELLSASVV